MLVQIIKQMAWECFVAYPFTYLYFTSLQKGGFSVAYRDNMQYSKMKRNFNKKR